MSVRADDTLGEPRTLRQALVKFQTLLTPDDRKEWWVLLATALIAGTTQSVILALLNAAAATIGTGTNKLPASLAVIGLVAAGMVAGYFGAVRGHVIGLRMGIRLRDRMVGEMSAANLRMIERIGVPTIHHHMMATIGRIGEAYGTLLGFVASLVILACNLAYIGWLSPIGLVLALTVAASGVLIHLRQEARNNERRIETDALAEKIAHRHYDVLRGYQELRLGRARFLDYRARIMRDNDTHTAVSAKVKRVSTFGDIVTHFFQFLLVFVLVFALPMLVPIDSVVALQLMSAVFITVGPLASAVSSIPDFGRLRSALISLVRLECEMRDTGEPCANPRSTRLAPFASIELRAVEFTFRDRLGHEGFHLGPLDFTLGHGEVVFVVGGNGSGKTVLLRVLTALYRHDQGTILYNGKVLDDSERDAYRELFAAVFSDYFLFRELVGIESINTDRVATLLAELDLTDKVTLADGGFSTIELSAGQRKRLAYVVAMLDDRPVLVLDEFGAEQDPQHRHRFYRDLLPRLRASGKTVVVVSHDDAYFDCADRIIKMDFGGIVDQTINAKDQRQRGSR